MTKREIVRLREEIQRIDSDILCLLARRNEVSAEIGLTKLKDGKPVKDSDQEERVLRRMSQVAGRLGLDEGLAEKLVRMLIADSVKVQMSRPRRPPLRDRKALVVGGAGRMGEWVCRFLSNRGAEVSVWDDRGRLSGYRNVRSIANEASVSDYSVIASPPGTCGKHLAEVLRSGSEGLVFDLCSVKSHISTILRDGARKGLMVSSAHPMFGPSAPSPKDLNVVVCPCGCEDADDDLTDLFRSAGAIITQVTLEDHDRLMAYVLGLPHICSLLFGSVIGLSGTSFDRLAGVHGPSFEKLSRLASEVCSESKRVYHDIQALNPHTKTMLIEFERAFQQTRKAALSSNPERFGAIMDSNRRFLGG